MGDESPFVFLSLHSGKWKKLTIHQNEEVWMNREDLLGFGSGGTRCYGGLIDEIIPVAVKEIPCMPRAAADERRVLLRVQHRNVLHSFGPCFDSPFFYLVLEKCDCNLEEFVRNGGPLKSGEHAARMTDPVSRKPTAAGLEIMRGMAEGVEALHVAKVVHRDLKPSNVLLKLETGGWVAKISDFGLSKIIPPEHQSSFETDRAGGTRGWQAPEQLLAETTQSRGAPCSAQMPLRS